MNTVFEIGWWLFTAICLRCWGRVVFRWALFDIARQKGWSHPDITPAEILERLATKDHP